MKTRFYLSFGFLVPLLFWSTIVVCGLMTEGYNHFTNMVSELGAMGTTTQYVFTAGLVVSSILSLFFILGLFKVAKAHKLSTIPVLMILTFTFSMFGAAIIPLPLPMHGIIGSPSMLLPLSPLLALLLWGKKRIPTIRIFSCLVLLIMLLGFLTLTKLMDQYFGLKQRFFHIGWTLWFIYLSYQFQRLNMLTQKNI